MTKVTMDKNNRSLFEMTHRDNMVGMTVMMNCFVIAEAWTELNMFKETNEFVKSMGTELLENKEAYHSEIMRMIRNQEMDTDRFVTICFHYLVTYYSVDLTMKNLQGQSIGFVIHINPFDFDSSEIISLEYEDWKRLTERMAA